MTDLLGSLFDEPECLEDNRAIDIFQEQARLIRSKSNGVVNCSFAKIEYKHNIPAVEKAVSSILDTLDKMQVYQTSESDKELIDINDLYKYTLYKFELYNDTYKFRILTLFFREFFPIAVEIDEGIANELSLSNTITIDSNKQLEDVLSTIFSTSKLKTIIVKMMDYKSNKIESGILSLLSDGSQMSISDICEKLKISKPVALSIMKKLEESGHATKEKIKKSEQWKLVTKE